MVYTESELILPTLNLLREHKNGLDMSNIIKILTKRLKPTGEDAKLLSGRKDTHFSQKVRNLTSHTTLAKKGLAVYEKQKGKRGGIYKITKAGLGYLEDNTPLVESLKEQGFNQTQINREIDKDFKGIIIEEGALEKRSVVQRKRSNFLRSKALDYFKNKLPDFGSLKCEVCNFDFAERYGEVGRDFIEIHHKSPISETNIRGSRTQLQEALNQLSPVCSNCHRMIHRNKGKMLTIEELKSKLSE